MFWSQKISGASNHRRPSLEKPLWHHKPQPLPPELSSTRREDRCVLLFDLS
jgi:hypothetical protein